MSFAQFPLSKGDRYFLETRAKTHTLPQTLLVEGGDETVRRALAKQIAAAIVCRDSENAPCGVCVACKKCASGNHPDIAVYAPEKKNAQLKVEVCRHIRQDAFVVPNDGDCKVYILEDSQNMNDSSENALLKILEEPPVGVYFILTCDSRAAMLPTVLSRAVVVSLQGARTTFSAETVQAAEGIADALCAGSEWTLLCATAPLQKDRDEIRNVLACLAVLFTDALCVQCGGNAPTAAQETANALAKRLPKQKLYAAFRETQALLQSAERNANTNLLLTGLCYRLRQAVEQK
ncbi:MAG: hypothetical protein ACI4LI_09190 [Candidatus Fimenecus sp.]